MTNFTYGSRDSSVERDETEQEREIRCLQGRIRDMSYLITSCEKRLLEYNNMKEKLEKELKNVEEGLL